MSKPVVRAEDRRRPGSSLLSPTAAATRSGRVLAHLLHYATMRIEVATPRDIAVVSAAVGKPGQSLGSKMQRLLERGMANSTGTAYSEALHCAVDQLVPDEACILSALADGSSSAVLHVYPWSSGSRSTSPLLENACLIGRTASVALPHLTPQYVRHLLALGLVDIGPEDTTLGADYEILQAEPAVMKALKRGARGPLPARLERHSLRLSAFGQGVCDACFGTGPA